MRPSEYSNTCLVMQDTACIIVRSDGEITGVPRPVPFRVGRVVYLPNQVKTLPNGRVVAWANGVGTIAVNRNALAQTLVIRER